MSEALIQLSHVSKIFAKGSREVKALDQLSLEFPPGSFTAICGPSGCGKSTMLSLIGGLAVPTSGVLTVAGQPISSMSSADRARFRAEYVGFVFQMFHLLPYLNIWDNVLLAASPTGGNDAEVRAEQLLDQFGLQSRRLHRPAELSAGERQRVAMARALLNQPKLLLADEPTGNLDPRNAAIVLDTLSAFHAAGGTVILVTHEHSAAERAETTVFLESGRLRDQAPKTD
jgi:putative ABC transport system ATP-binding protein